MTDLRTRFRSLDSLHAPNLWHDIEERALTRPPAQGRGLWVLIAVALLLGLVIGGVTLVGSGIVKLPISVDASATPSSTSPESTVPSSSPDEQRPESWIATGNMVESRSSHSATLLLDGRVLVAGGSGNASAELYDPQTGTWTATGSMIKMRSGHTATLLRDGRVLVAGGLGGDVSAERYDSAELYDPATGTWIATGTMTESRANHTATMLDDGTVLAVGGADSASAELYDPQTGTWTATTNMVVGDRWLHTATLLPDGKVLVTGGRRRGSRVDLGHAAAVATGPTAELYDPNAGAWTATGSMGVIRYEHTATLLQDGTVLVVGTEAGDPTSSELYDPQSGSWSFTGSMALGRAFGLRATLLRDGRVLVTGGVLLVSEQVNGASAELYDPKSLTWITTVSLGAVREYHTATLLLDGRVLVAGGERGVLGSVSAELYDPDSGN
jgi:WD40 repeat protein